jgi:hypothetical protein
VNKHLNLQFKREGYEKKSYGRQPYLGKPAVRDENGGSLKRELGQFGLRPLVKAEEVPPKFKTARAANLSKLIGYALVFISIFSLTPCFGISVGDSFGGGTVFCVSQTADTTQCETTGSGCFGLIMANKDQVNYNSNVDHGVYWSTADTSSIPGALSDDDGAANTAAIIAALPSDNSSNNAAWLCHNYSDPTEGHDDWYLPSKNELNKMYLYANANNLIGTGCTGSEAGGVQCLIGGGSTTYKYYWSSTEYCGGNDGAWVQEFSGGGQYYYYKIGYYFGARAARAFNDSTNLTIYQFTKSGYENIDISFAAIDFTNNFDCCGTSLEQIKVLSLPANGTLKLSDTPVTGNQMIPVGDLGDLTFEPDANWNGNTSFSWNGSDGTEYATSAANVDINIEEQPFCDEYTWLCGTAIVSSSLVVVGIGVGAVKFYIHRHKARRAVKSIGMV